MTRRFAVIDARLAQIELELIFGRRLRSYPIGVSMKRGHAADVKEPATSNSAVLYCRTDDCETAQRSRGSGRQSWMLVVSSIFGNFFLKRLNSLTPSLSVIRRNMNCLTFNWQ